jgi:hypothetical protein
MTIAMRCVAACDAARVFFAQNAHRSMRTRAGIAIMGSIRQSGGAVAQDAAGAAKQGALAEFP